MKKSDAYIWFSKLIVSICAMMLLLLFVVMCIGGLSRTFLSTKDHIGFTFANKTYEGETFLEDRTFSDSDIIVTSFDKAAMDSSGARPFSVSVESFLESEIELNNLTVLGPFGIKIVFEEGTCASEYGFESGYVKSIRHPQTDEDGVVRLAHYNESYIYLLNSKQGEEDKTIVEVAEDKWNELANNGWAVSIKNSDGTLMNTSGFYELLIIIKEYSLAVESDGSYKVIHEEYQTYSYKISANDSGYFVGMLQKNGAQNDYKFQLSLMKGEDLLIPRSDKITVPSGGVMKLGVCSSERFKMKNVVMKLYNVNEENGQTTLCREHHLSNESEGRISQVVELDFKGLESGVYRITVEGDFNARLAEISSATELVRVFFSGKTEEVYEYYFKIGDLQ